MSQEHFRVGRGGLESLRLELGRFWETKVTFGEGVGEEFLDPGLLAIASQGELAD